MRITWFGHSAFRLDIDNAHILIDPFLNGNPAFVSDFDQAIAGVTHIVLTHGHGDHVGDTVAIAAKTGAQVLGNFETCLWLETKGVKNFAYLNHGGSLDTGPFVLSLTQAIHSSTEMIDGQLVSLGNPCGVVIAPKSGPVVYHMGDTEIFGDMALINEIYAPQIVIVPIGDRFTMGPRTGALAINRFFHHVRMILPCHYGTFPVLTGTVAAFAHELGVSATKLAAPKCGETINVE
jgi:L-ascorbate metabolism protein UlaG (beta-lactamase superfamily)